MWIHYSKYDYPTHTLCTYDQHSVYPTLRIAYTLCTMHYEHIPFTKYILSLCIVNCTLCIPCTTYICYIYPTLFIPFTISSNSTLTMACTLYTLHFFSPFTMCIHIPYTMYTLRLGYHELCTCALHCEYPTLFLTYTIYTIHCVYTNIQYVYLTLCSLHLVSPTLCAPNEV